MLKNRIIPALLIKGGCLVKTVNFSTFNYIGDPCNTVRIFNEMEVDEIFILDISATLNNKEPDIKLLNDISNECFMPTAYGGGIRNFDQVKKIFDCGFEKVVLNSSAYEIPGLIESVSRIYGSQALVVSIDVKKGFWGKQTVRIRNGKVNTHLAPEEWALTVEKKGAGEILLTSIDREGTWEGFDIDLVKKITNLVSIPVVAHGGAGKVEHVRAVFDDGKASGAALGSMMVFQKKGMGVLVNNPFE